jgi:hypothetical protein
MEDHRMMFIILSYIFVTINICGFAVPEDAEVVEVADLSRKIDKSHILAIWPKLK